MCSQMEFQRKVLGEAKFPVYILQGANDLGQVEIRSLFLVIVFHLSYLCLLCVWSCSQCSCSTEPWLWKLWNNRPSRGWRSLPASTIPM